jgi:hypothetical protein
MSKKPNETQTLIYVYTALDKEWLDRLKDAYPDATFPSVTSKVLQAIIEGIMGQEAIKDGR